ncbi:MAG: hypothetical protein ACI8XG_000152, partial [Congregibacter sp.]
SVKFNQHFEYVPTYLFTPPLKKHLGYFNKLISAGYFVSGLFGLLGKQKSPMK